MAGHIDQDFVTIESARLVIRRFRDADLAHFVAYRAQPDVARYQSWAEGFSHEDGARFLAGIREGHPGVPGAWFQFALAQKGHPEKLIGDCGLCVTADDPSTAEMGFTLAPAYQGQGYAAEAVTALIGYVFGRLNIRRIVAITDVRNDRSVRVLERVGMRREGHFIDNVYFKGAWGSEYAYAMLRTEWAAGQLRVGA